MRSKRQCRWPGIAVLTLCGCVAPRVPNEDAGGASGSDASTPASRSIPNEDAGGASGPDASLPALAACAASNSSDAAVDSTASAPPDAGLGRCGFDPSRWPTDFDSASYDGGFIGNAVPCPDGLICNLDHGCVTPRYCAPGAGTVLDEVTGLVWQQEVSTSASNPYGFRTWPQAQAYCQNLALGAYDAGWTLPTVDQLFSLVEEGQYQFINADAFPGFCPPNEYWSSSTVSGFEPQPGAWWWVWWSFPGNIISGDVGFFIGGDVATDVRCVHPAVDGSDDAGLDASCGDCVDAGSRQCGFDPTCSPSIDNANCAVICMDSICDLNGECETPSYTVSDAGTVADNVTGLTWQQDTPAIPCPRDPSGLCTSAEAQQYCETLDLGGYAGGWTLPTEEQLFSLILLDPRRGSTIDSSFVVGFLQGYLTSTPEDGWSDAVWGVTFGVVGAYTYDSAVTPGNVRCVRAP